MQLAPRYGADPVLTIDGPRGAIAAPTIRQRKRLAEVLVTLDTEQWDHPSRCEGWSCRDVIVHLESTNGFWAYSISSGVGGEPTELLATFDPVASPAELVDASSEVSTGELLDRFVASSSALADLLASLGDDDWAVAAEAPPGHLSVSAVAHHALWDSWVHERDVLLPLGLVPDEEPDEVAAALRYVAALAPALALNLGHGRSGTLAIETTAPELAFTVEVGDTVSVRSGADTADFVLTGNAVELVEGLSFRAPLPAGTSTELTGLLSGLADTFDIEPG